MKLSVMRSVRARSCLEAQADDLDAIPGWRWRRPRSAPIPDRHVTQGSEE
jgi:hypothetical protein